MTPLHVILTKLLVRLSAPRDKQDQRNQSGPIFDSVTTTCHPDNAPGQDPYLSRKTGQTIGPGQSLFSLTAVGGPSFFSAERFLEQDAETCSGAERTVGGQQGLFSPYFRLQRAAVSMIRPSRPSGS